MSEERITQSSACLLYTSINNFAIIENTEIDFEDGLNIITGETGSGKSIVIEAISLSLIHIYCRAPAKSQQDVL